MMSAVRGYVRERGGSEPNPRGSFFGPGQFFVLGSKTLNHKPRGENSAPPEDLGKQMEA